LFKGIVHPKKLNIVYVIMTVTSFLPWNEIYYQLQLINNKKRERERMHHNVFRSYMIAL